MIFSSLFMKALEHGVAGQEYVVGALTRAVTLALARDRQPNTVPAVVMFVGPVGSGRNEMLRSLARALAGSERKIIRVNCRDVDQSAEPISPLSRQLLAGYWQFINTPPIGMSIFQIVVLENIDKASANFRDDIAAAIDRGELYTPGLLFPLRNSFIILMTDLSRKKADQIIGRPIGFFLDGESSLDAQRAGVAVLEEMDLLLGARLVSRVDEIIVFERFNEQHITAILERRLTEIERHLSRFFIGFTINQEAKTFLLKKGQDDITHGSRQITRALKNYVEFPIADLLLSGRLPAGCTVAVGHELRRNFLNFQVLIPRFLQMTNDK